MATKKVELLRPYGMHTKGAILDPDSPVADLLIQSGRAKAIEERQPEAPSKARPKIQKQAWVK